MAYSSESASRGFIPPKDDHERLVMRRAEELTRAAEGSGRVRWTSFLSDREQDLCVAAMNRTGCSCYGFEGGFEQAERKLLCIRPAGAYGEPPLCCVRVKFGQLGPGHRDVLGSVLGLGVKRESLGDIFLGDAPAIEAYLCALEPAARLLCQELTSVGRVPASAEIVPFDQLPTSVQAPQRHSVTVTVASLRADSVLAAMLRISRGQACELIRAGRVSINHIPVTAAHTDVYEGDVFTVRGTGRFCLQQLGGKSRKDRLFITYFQYG